MSKLMEDINNISEQIQDLYVNSYLEMKRMGYYPPERLDIHHIYKVTNWKIDIKLPKNIRGIFGIEGIMIVSYFNFETKYRIYLVDNEGYIINLEDGLYYDIKNSKGYYESNEREDIMEELRRLTIYLGFCKKIKYIR